MKKKNLKNLKLNKKIISNFQIKGGVPPVSERYCPIKKTENPNACADPTDNYLSLIPGIICY